MCFLLLIRMLLHLADQALLLHLFSEELCSNCSTEIREAIHLLLKVFL